MEIINEFGRTKLHRDILFEDDDITVIETINECDDINQVDNMGYSYLHFAAENVRPKIVKALLIKGAEVNMKHSGGSIPLRKALGSSGCYPKERLVETVKVLIEYGADINDIRYNLSLRELAEDRKNEELIDLFNQKTLLGGE